MNHPKRTGLLILSASALLCCAGAVYAQTRDSRSQKMKERLEQLFIWRVSDKLELTPQEENKFSDEYHKLTEEKSKLTEKMEETLDQIDKVKDDPSKSAKLLNEYESTLKDYDQTQSKEMSVMGRLFGTKRMVKYVLLKREMRQKFKDFLVSNGNVKPVEKATLKEPEVYQEK